MNRVASGTMMMSLAGAAIAAPFQNGSFESGGPACFQFSIPAGSTAIPGWIVSTGNIDWNGPPPCSYVASNGTHSLDLVGTGGVGGIQQTFDTTPGVTYRVSFDLAGNPGAPPAIKPLTVTVDGVTMNYTFDITGHTQTSMGWETKTFAFVASGTSATINFVSDVTASGGTLNAGAALDNVQIAAQGAAATAQPIPLDWAQWAAALLLAVAGGVLIWRKAGR